MRQLRTKRPAPHQRGTGAFELLGVVQEPSAAITTELKDSLSSQPGIRLQGGGSRRVYFGGLLTPQRFTRPPSTPNDVDQVRAAILHVNSPRHMRGRVIRPELSMGVGE